MADNLVPTEDLPDNIVPSEDLPEGIKGIQTRGGIGSQILSEVARPFATTGREIYEGLKQAVSPPGAEPGGMLEWITQGPQGGPLAIPPNPVSDMLAKTIQSGMGLVRAATAPVTGFVMEPLQRGIRSLTEPLLGEQGAEIAGETAALAGGLLAPQGLMAPGMLQRAGRFLTRPARPILEAEQVNMARQAQALQQSEANRLINEQAMAAKEAQEAGNVALNLQSRQQYELAQVHRNYAQQQATLARQRAEQAGLVISQPGAAPFTRTSAMAEAARVPTTTTEAYGFLKTATPARILEMPTVSNTIKELSLKAAQGGPQEITGQLTSAMFQKAGFVPGQKNTLDTTRALIHEVGQMRKHSDPVVGGVAGRIYRDIMDDLRFAAKTQPEAGQLYAATRVARQNLGAEELADYATNLGTRVDKVGQLHIQRIRNKLTTDEFLRESFPPEALAQIEDTLNTVFRAHEEVAKARTAIPKVPTEPKLLPEKVKPPSLLPEEISYKEMTPKERRSILERHPVALSSAVIGAGVGGALGLTPAAIYGGTVAGAIFYPRMIFKAALKPKGQQFLRTLYKDIPPMVNDTGRMQAVANFLQSQGETP